MDTPLLGLKSFCMESGHCRDDRKRSHPKVTVTPHSGGDPFPDIAAKVVAENILRFRRGEALPHLFDRDAGY